MRKSLSTNLAASALALGIAGQACATTQKIECDVFGGDTGVAFMVNPIFENKEGAEFSGRPKLVDLNDDCVGSISSKEDNLYLSTSESCTKEGGIFGTAVENLKWDCNQAVNVCVAPIEKPENVKMRYLPNHIISDLKELPDYVILPCGENNYHNVLRIKEGSVSSLNGDLVNCTSSYKVGAPIYEVVYKGGKIYEKEKVEGCEDLYGMAAFSYGPLVGVVTHEFMDSLKK